MQTDRTGDSIAAIIGRSRTRSEALARSMATELTKAINSNVRGLPSEFESGSGVLGALERNAILGRP